VEENLSEGHSMTDKQVDLAAARELADTAKRRMTNVPIAVQLASTVHELAGEVEALRWALRIATRATREGPK
jgi:hypothetical protein